MRLSILDDYQGVALDVADWSPGRSRGVDIAVERKPFAGEDEAARALADSEIVAAMRERTPFPRSLVERLPKDKPGEELDPLLLQGLMSKAANEANKPASDKSVDKEVLERGLSAAKEVLARAQKRAPGITPQLVMASHRQAGERGPLRHAADVHLIARTTFRL